MSDFLRNFIEEQERMRRLIDGPLREYRRQQAAVAHFTDLVSAKDLQLLQIPDAVREAQLVGAEIVALAKQSLASYGIRESLLEMQKYAQEHREMYLAMERAALPYKEIQEQVRTMSLYFDSAQLDLTSIDAARFGALLNVDEMQRGLLRSTTLELERTHANLLASLSLTEGRLASILPFVSELPTLDLFVHGRAIRSVTPHKPLAPPAEERSTAMQVEISNETAAFLEIHLPELNPAFLLQYRGARAAAKERGPDWWTHSGASLRKLLKGVLHSVADNETVGHWAQAHGKEFDRNGRPTRATKVEWLCEFIPNAAYPESVKAQLTAALAIISLLDESQHENESSDFEEKFEEIFLRAETAIRHIVTIWKARPTH